MHAFQQNSKIDSSSNIINSNPKSFPNSKPNIKFNHSMFRN